MTEPIFILLVEGEDIVRETLDTALAEAGFQVIFAFDEQEATAELSLNQALYRAVITDVRKANGSGSWDVAQRARELVEEMPIIYINGEGSRDWFIKGVPNSLLISRPFLPAQVVTAVLTLLNTQTPKLAFNRIPRPTSGNEKLETD
jgi:DNA-binding response OmpR family regulator